jgi:L-asparaginase
MTPRISIIGTGGTISGVNDARRRSGAGLDPVRLAEMAGHAEPRAEVRFVDACRIPGRAMTPSIMRDIAATIRGELSAGSTGVVVTHGTDTLEETAYGLALMLEPGQAPIAVTGAMRLPDDVGYDGGANLAAALTAVADDRLRRCGPVVVFHDEIHHARWVTKRHSSSVTAFSSPETGPIASIVEGRVLLDSRTAPSDHLGLPDDLGATRVELIWVAAGMDGRLVELAADHADGLVVAGTGGGHTPPPVAAAIERAVANGCPVVVATRCQAGSTLSGTYGGVGGEEHLRSIGVIMAGRIPALKARLRLQVALALGETPGEVFPT